MKKTFLVVLLATIFSGFYVVKDYIIPSTWNYRITIEIETPEGIKTESVVRQVRAWKNITKFVNPDVRAVQYRVIGEAVAIDLGDRGVLLHLNDWDSNAMVANAFPATVKGEWDKVVFYKHLKVGRKVIQTGWKSFVWLDKSNDTKNLQRLDSKDFQVVLGDEIKLKQTVIEITNDSVSWKIETLFEEISKKLGRYRKSSFQNRK